jgi:ketosteroid isomerase-like protein
MGDAAVQSALGTFLRALSGLDLEALLDCFAPGATAFLPGEYHRTRLQGTSEIADAFATVFSRVRATGAASLSVDVQELSAQEWGDAAVVTFHLRGEHLSRRTLVFRRQEAGWRIVHLHASNTTIED